MDYEQQVFQRRQVKWDTLVPYGFIKQDDIYVLNKQMSDESLCMEIQIDSNGNVHGKIMDTAFDQEYINYRLEQSGGTYVSRIREEFIACLTDICEHCFCETYFHGDQANRIAKRIEALYGDLPAFLWEKTPDSAVYKHTSNEKWYAAVLHIKGKAIHVPKETIDIINVKLPPAKIQALLKRDGFLPAYHMSKTNWITMLMDDTLSDDEIMTYVEESYRDTKGRDIWLVPANPAYYDVITALQKQDTITWKQAKGMAVGHRVFLYVGTPYSAILFQCVVIETDIEEAYQDEHLSMKKQVRLKRVAMYDQSQYPLSLLKQYGVKGVRAPRYMPEALYHVIK